LLRDLNKKLGREYIFKPTIRNERLHEISNNNVVRVLNFATSKNVISKITMFSRRNIHEYNWTSPYGKTLNETDHFLIGDSIHV
jgi:hypothetical protein